MDAEDTFTDGSKRDIQRQKYSDDRATTPSSQRTVPILPAKPERRRAGTRDLIDILYGAHRTRSLLVRSFVPTRPPRSTATGHETTRRGEPETERLQPRAAPGSGCVRRRGACAAACARGRRQAVRGSGAVVPLRPRADLMKCRDRSAGLWPALVLI